jgi:hypothetical protein
LGMDGTIYSTHTLEDYKEHSGLSSQRVKHFASRLICTTLSTKLLNSSVCPSRRAGNSAGSVMHWQTTKPSSRCQLPCKGTHYRRTNPTIKTIARFFSPFWTPFLG